MLEPLGLILSIPVLIIATSFAGDEFSWKGVLISAVVLTVASWAHLHPGAQAHHPGLALVRAVMRPTRARLWT